ncbi:hypothetical protein PMIN06_010478 [Paraphaeosphaeria minitans]|uniref:Holo-acyl-carrier-protein synthase n=1 Tax=Paraphaeosphaeria minitans TaxID=565426 RepID=A0A9P6KQ45_9PLEO|nr:holo-acyl-carrier-protein synthase [Paraphaeosphaeria minitans]
MPPRPFPLSFRIGNDICSINRIHDILKPKTGDSSSSLKGPPFKRFISKLLTWPERNYFYTRFPYYKDVGEDTQILRNVSYYLAGRWAAKEAVRKACEHLGDSNGFHSIMILPVSVSSRQSLGATSRPQALVLRDRLLELSPQQEDKAMSGGMEFDIDSLDGQLCEVSISHDTTYATAVALVPVVGEWQSQAAKLRGQDPKS